MANALALPDPTLMLQPTGGTMPAPAPMQPKANALVASSPYMATPKKPQNQLFGAAVDGFQRGFDPAGREKQMEQSKADGMEKAKQTLTLMQQQRQLPAEQRTQWWTQNAPQIGQIIGQDLSQQPVDPNAFTDEALDGQIAMLSGKLGIAPATPDPMSAYEAAQIKLKEEEASRGPKAAIYNTPHGLVEAAPGAEPKLVYETKPEEKPPWPGAIKGQDGQWEFDPNYIKGYRQLHPQQPSAGSARYENVPSDQMEALGYPKGTVGQRNVATNQIEVKSRPSTAQTGQPTESERAGSLHSQIALNGLGNIMRMEAGGYNRAGMQEQAAGLFGGENERLYDQAALEFADGYLRAMTGAAQTEGEVQRNARQFFPQFGDGEKVIKQKNAGRLNALKAMKSKAGRAWNPEWDSMIRDLESAVGGGGIAPAVMGERTDPADDNMDGFIDGLFPADDGAPDQIPEGITPEEWDAMPPEDKALFQ